MDYLLHEPLYLLLIMLVLLLAAHLMIRLRLYIIGITQPTARMAERPSISVVIIARTNGALLEANVARIAEQDYPNYDIIIVNATQEEDVKDAITRLEQRYANIRHTFVPPTTRFMSQKKLAITLGVKASQSEWIVLTQDDCHPDTERWLSTLAQGFTPEHDFVFGYVNYEPQAGKRLRLVRLREALRYFCAARGKVVGANGGNLAFRRNLFMQIGAFASQLDLLEGDDVLLVDHHAGRNRCLAVTHPDAAVHMAEPMLHRFWHTERCMLAEAARQLSRHGRRERLVWGLGTLCGYAVLFGGAALAVLLYMKTYVVLAACVLAAMVLAYAAKLVCFARAARIYGEGGLTWLLPFADMTQPVYNLVYRIAGRRSRRKLRRGL